MRFFFHLKQTCPGADPGFQVRGGALKKIAPSGGRRENFWGISCEKSRFYAQKNHIFPILGGGARAGGAPPPESAPDVALSSVRQSVCKQVSVLSSLRILSNPECRQVNMFLATHSVSIEQGCRSREHRRHMPPITKKGGGIYVLP